jgi:acyl dehydratase
MLVIRDSLELKAHIGQEVAWSDWVTVTQAHIDLFAQATGDHQWIHIHPEQAAAGPFGTTIAHGFLTLSLLPQLFASAMVVEGSRMGINYGLNKVRFTAPVPVNSRLRAAFTPQHIEALPDGGTQTTWDVVVQREGSPKPVCLAQSLVRHYR